MATQHADGPEFKPAISAKRGSRFRWGEMLLAALPWFCPSSAVPVESSANLHRNLRICIALVWLVMGLGFKVLGLEPRHREIVGRILGEAHAPTITIFIGFGEIFMAVWILSGICPRLCAALQIALVAAMNVLELAFARDLLLFGAGNLLAALAFICLVLFTEKIRPTP